MYIRKDKKSEFTFEIINYTDLWYSKNFSTRCNEVCSDFFISTNFTNLTYDPLNGL